MGWGCSLRFLGHGHLAQNKLNYFLRSESSVFHDTWLKHQPIVGKLRFLDKYLTCLCYRYHETPWSVSNQLFSNNPSSLHYCEDDQTRERVSCSIHSSQLRGAVCEYRDRVEENGGSRGGLRGWGHL